MKFREKIQSINYDVEKLGEIKSDFIPTSERRIQHFENKHDIILPDDFREFLLHRTSDTAPGHGLDWTLGSFGCSSRTFPHLTTWEPNRDVDIPEDRQLNLNIDNNNDEDLDRYYNWLWDGTIIISCDGCDVYNLLVVTGPERGNMWLTANEAPYLIPVSGLVEEPTSENGGCFTYGGSGRLSFLNWYQHWIKLRLHFKERG